ncbi:MAG: hypothetical protein ACREPT_11825 [Rudaea sp.]
MSTSSEPRDWALATVANFLGLSNHRTEYAGLLDRAVAAAPNDALVQWLALMQTNNSAAAQDTHDRALQNLQSIEPDNAAVWMQALMFAQRRRNDAEVDAALARMTASTRFDDHVADLIKVMRNVYSQHPLPEEYSALEQSELPELAQEDTRDDARGTVAAVSVAAAIALPAYQPLINACTVNGVQAARAGACALIGRLMAGRGTDLIARSIGYAVLRVSGTFNDDDIRRSRNDDWLRQEMVAATVYPPTHESTRNGVTYVNDWCATNSEIEAMRRAVSRAGRAPRPPVDWIDTQSPFSAERLRNDKLAAAHAAAQAH